jgi:hypothetical protein
MFRYQAGFGKLKHGMDADKSQPGRMDEMMSPTTAASTRRQVLQGLTAGALIGLIPVIAPPALAALKGPPAIKVYKSPSCGCCGQWAKYLKQNGFRPEIVDMDDVSAVKRLAQVPDDLASCHTAVVDRYVVEGHVPVEAIRKMLSERPNILGIAVPGMPSGSPGMPGGGTRERYHVIAFASQENHRPYMSF